MERPDATTGTGKCPSPSRSCCPSCLSPCWVGSKSSQGHSCGLLLCPKLHFSWGWGRKGRQAGKAGGGRGDGGTLGKDNGLCKILLWAAWPSSMASGHMNSKKNVAQEFLPNDPPSLSLWEFGATDTFLPWITSTAAGGPLAAAGEPGWPFTSGALPPVPHPWGMSWLVWGECALTGRPQSLLCPGLSPPSTACSSLQPTVQTVCVAAFYILSPKSGN